MDLAETFARGATYSGAWTFIAPNYLLLVLGALPFFLAREGERARGWLAASALAWGLQIAFWFTLGAEGVSVVWCTQAGLFALVAARGRTPGEGPARLAQTTFLTLAALAVAFYAATLPAISTVAHLCAALLGVGVGWVAAKVGEGPAGG